MNGEWKPRQIDNTPYKGVWAHMEIENPEYNKDATKDNGKYAQNRKICFDLWQVKSGTTLDNMMITDYPAEAKTAGEALWAATKDWEEPEHIANPYTNKYAKNCKTVFNLKQAYITKTRETLGGAVQPCDFLTPG